MEWISVSEKLPPLSFVESDDAEDPYESNMILLYISNDRGSEHSEILVGIYEEEDLSPFPNIPSWASYNGGSWHDLETYPTHWMPLPAPPL